MSAIACTTCDSLIDEDGLSLSSCSYGSSQCDDCGACYCDGAC